MAFWVSVGVRAALTALALHPWADIGSRMLQRDNPFSPLLMALWIAAAAAVTRGLRSRPRRRLTHVLGHGVAAGYGFALWLGVQRGVPMGLPTAGWWRAWAEAGARTATATELFWLIWWGALWYWGIRTADGRPGRAAAAGEFALGLGGWGLALLFAYASDVPTAPLLGSLFAYFLLGLVWQGMNRGAAAEAGVSGHTDAPPDPSSLALLALTGTAAYAVMGALFGWADPFRAGVDGTAAVVGPWLLALLRWLFGRPAPVDPGPAVTAEPRRAGMELSAGEGGPLPFWLEALLWALLGVAVLAALAALGVALLRGLCYLLGRAGASEPRPKPGAKQTWAALAAEAWRALRRALGRVGNALREAAAWVSRQGAAVGETVWPRDVSALYRGFLRWGRLVGFPRRPWETPREYARRLAEAYPAAADDVGCITRAYERAAYGEGGGNPVPPPRDVLAAYRLLYRPGRLAEGWRSRARAVLKSSRASAIIRPAADN